MSERPTIEEVLSGQAKLVSEEFDLKIKRGDGCWEWQGRLMTTGYPKWSVCGKWKSGTRIAYQFLFGPLPSGINVCHKCDNPKCVRPDHLFAGTMADNNRDMWDKGRGVVPTNHSFPGGTNPMAVLTERDVQLILSLVFRDVPQKVVAEVFGVSGTTISSIVRGKRWSST